VTDIRLITDRHTKRSKGLAYIEFSKQEEVFAALTLTGQVRRQATVHDIWPYILQHSKLACTVAVLQRSWLVGVPRRGLQDALLLLLTLSCVAVLCCVACCSCCWVRQ
jgi:hypothetical protein